MSMEPPFYEPPKRWMRFLRWFCADRFLEEIEGDLLEWYQHEVETNGEQHARRKFKRQLFPYLRPYFFRKQILSPSISPAVLTNYLKIVVRSFKRNKWTAGLNLLGLALGFAVFILIGVYVQYESNFENFHSKADRIYRPTMKTESGQDFTVHWARIPWDFINHLPDEIPEIEHLIRFQNQDRRYVKIGEEKFQPKHAYVTDADVFEVFDFSLVAGNSKTALVEPNSVVITQKLAQQYFGHEQVVGEQFTITSDMSDTPVDYKITGVMKDLPSNTHLPVEMLLSFANEQERRGWAYIYTLLAPGANMDAVEAKLPTFMANHVEPDRLGSMQLVFQPLPDIHLTSNLAREITPNGSALYVRIFALVALFILAIAIINFVNLNSALAVGRAKEMGVRKVLGASRGHTRFYAFTEAVVYNLSALMLGVALAAIVFPSFQQLTGVNFIGNIWLYGVILIAIAFGSGLIAGIYPAAVLNRLQLATVVKAPKVLRVSGLKVDVRRLLVGLQFGIAILLIGCAWVAYQQLKYIENRNLGMAKAQILAMDDVPDPVTAGYMAFREECMKLPGVQQVAACMQVPSSAIRDSGPVLVKGKNEDASEAPYMDMQVIDPDFMEMMQMELVAGTIPEFQLNSTPNLSEDYTLIDYINDQPRSYLINEEAMEQLGWQDPSEAIGQEISWSIGPFQLAMGPVTGVVKNFHQESLKNKIDPVLLTYDPIWLRTFMVKVETQNLDGTLADIGGIWSQHFPNYPFEYHFLDELFNQLYQSERVQLRLLSAFSLLSILIAILGLFSLVAYHLQTRLKEIAIRKVLGANVFGLIQMISKDYIWLVLIGGILAIPLTYIGIQRWLENFAYTVPIAPIWFVLPLIGVILLLLIVIGFQTLRSSRINPSELLRQE